MSESDDEPRDPSSPSSASSPPGPSGDVGSVGEEAAKLLGALAGWACEQEQEAADGADRADRADRAGDPGASESAGASTEDLRTSLGGLAARLARTWREIDEHVATGAPECSYCPLCRTVHVVRSTSPEVRAHLATAAGSLLEAGLQVLGSLPTGETARPEQPRRSRDVHHIDLDDESGPRGPEEHQ